GHCSRSVFGVDRFARGHEVEPVDRFIVLAYEVVALGRAWMVVEGDTGTDHVDKSRAAMQYGRLDQRHELRLVAGKASRDECRTELQRKHDHVDGLIAVDGPSLALRASVRGRGKLSLGQPVNTVVLDDIEHVDATPHGMSKLSEPDGRRIPVARHAEINEITVREISARQDRRHASMHAI